MSKEQTAEQALRGAAADRGPLFLYGDFVALRNEINGKLEGSGIVCHAIMVSNYQRVVVGQFREGEDGEIFEVIIPETELAAHEHAWPAELSADATCENGCGLRYDQWQEPAEQRIQREHEEQLARDAAALAAEHDDPRPEDDTPSTETA